ncbi:hypothetical protein O181_047775 [Austropuccinia psidii MF-1]|uniref:Uncharacterized protein n=1 Tax=Austropuccinia psidii MF-1 TaxID=1389203 RepID=A0A9Q3HNI5_9BASI|nr:hypothetical protein [Austropuccinia psidii MF-1]
MIKIQEPSRPWEIVHMDWVTGLLPGGDRSYNASLVIVDSNKDPKFTSALRKNLHQLFGTKLSFSTAYHLQADGLAERTSQVLQDMVIISCEFAQELKTLYGFTHYWCTLLPTLELEYKKSINFSTNQTPAILEKG